MQLLQQCLNRALSEPVPVPLTKRRLWTCLDLSGVGAKLRDTIGDFDSGVDKINLRDIDANTLRDGNQNFRAIDGAFTHHAGELHVLHKIGFEVLEGDTNGDGKADFQIKVVGDDPQVSDIIR